MSRKHKLIAGLSVGCAVYVLFCLFTGGIRLFGGHDFTLKSLADTGQGYRPEVRIAKSRERSLLLIPFALRVYHLTPSHDILLYQENHGPEHQLLEISKHYRSFTLDSLRIQYEDGTVTDLVDPKAPVEQRTFLPVKWPMENIVDFKGAITKEQNFKISFSGYSTRINGEQFPFSGTDVYRYEPVHFVMTGWEETSIKEAGNEHD